MEFFKRKHTSEPAEENLIALPEFDLTTCSPVDILTKLSNGDTIWGWYKADKLHNGQINYIAMMNLSLGFEGLAVYRKEENYLVKYNVDISKDNKIYTKISSICRFVNSNIMELYNTELKMTHKLFLDNDSEFFANCMCYISDVNIDMIERELAKNRVFYIDDTYYYKKTDYPDGPPVR